MKEFKLDPDFIDLNSLSLQQYPITIADRVFKLQEMTQEETSSYAAKLAALYTDGLKKVKNINESLYGTPVLDVEGGTLVQYPNPNAEVVKAGRRLLDTMRADINALRAFLLIPDDNKDPVTGEWLRKNASSRQLRLIDTAQYILNDMDDNSPDFLLERILLPAEDLLPNPPAVEDSVENIGEELGQGIMPASPPSSSLSDPSESASNTQADKSSSSSDS